LKKNVKYGSEKMHSVTITGFKTAEAARQFRDYFCEQGEQDITIWW